MAYEVAAQGNNSSGLSHTRVSHKFVDFSPKNVQILSRRGRFGDNHGRDTDLALRASYDAKCIESINWIPSMDAACPTQLIMWLTNGL